MDEARLQKLETAVESLSSRLTQIEAVLARVPGAVIPRPVSPPPAKAPQTSQISPKEKNAASGGVWLAGVGILFFVLAATFFVKLAIDSGWLTPVRQLGGTILFGIVLIAAGYRLKGRDAPYAAFLPAGGVIVLYLAAYAGHLYWLLFSETTAILFAGGLSLFSLYLFRGFQHEFFLIAAVCGSYSVPLLIGIGRRHQDPFNTCIYFLFWDALFCACSVLLGRRIIIGLAAYLALGVWYFLFEMWVTGDAYLFQAALFEAVQCAILAGGVALYSVKRKSGLTAGEAWSLMPALLLFYAVEYHLLSKSVPDLAPWISLGFGAFLFLLYTWARVRLQKQSLESEPVLITFVALTIFHALYLEILPAPWGTIFALGLIPALGAASKSRFSFDRFWPAYFVAALAVASEYLNVLQGPAAATQLAPVFELLFFAGLFAAYYLRRTPSDSAAPFLFLALLQLLAAVKTLADRIASEPESLYLTSGSWAILAIALLTFAHGSKDAVLARASMGVLALVAGKVLFIDISSSGSLARIVALIVIGALLYFAGFLWRRIGEWKTEQ